MFKGNNFINVRRSRITDRLDHTDPRVMARVHSQMTRSGLTEQDADKIIRDFLEPNEDAMIRQINRALVVLYLQGRVSVEWREGRDAVWNAKE